MSDIIFVFLYLTYFIQYDNLQVYPCCCKWHYFLLMTEQHSLVYMYHIFFIHSSVDGHLGCFHIFVINSAAMNIEVHISFQIMLFSGYMPWSGIAESCGSSSFSFLKKLYNILHGGCTNLHSHQDCKRIPSSPCSLQHLLFVDFQMMMAILTDVR